MTSFRLTERAYDTGVRRRGLLPTAVAALVVAAVLAALGVGEVPGVLSDWQAFALGVVQGFTELLPISSSGHLILVPWLGDWTYLEQHPGFNKTFDVALHLGTLIAVVAAGAIPFESGLETIDMLGLNDEHIAHRDLEVGLLPAGHEKYDSEYVLDRRPDIIILADFLTDYPFDEGAYSALGGTLIAARADLLSRPRLWAEYEARSVEIEEGRWFNMLVRRQPVAVQASEAGPPPARPRSP